MSPSRLLSTIIVLPFVFSWVSPAHAEEADCSAYEECMAPVMAELPTDLDCSAYEGMEPPEHLRTEIPENLDPISAIGWGLADAFYGIGVCFLDAINALPVHFREQVFDCTVMHPECDDISRYGELDLPPVERIPEPDVRHPHDRLWEETYGDGSLPQAEAPYGEFRNGEWRESALPLLEHPLHEAEEEKEERLAEQERRRQRREEEAEELRQMSFGAQTIHGDVSYRDGYDDEWKPLTSDVEVHGNMQFMTGFESEVTVIFPDGTTLEVPEMSSLNIREVLVTGDIERWELLLKVGTLRVFTPREAAIPSDYGRYTSKAPNATIASRGTVYEVQTDGTDTIVKLFEGEVEVTSIFTGERVIMNAGEKLAVIGSDPVKQPEVMSAEEIAAVDLHGSAPRSDAKSAMGFGRVGIALVILVICAALYVLSKRKTAKK